jgi:hypothetical protein
MIDLTKRYLVFAGESYYPQGGINDCRGSVDDLYDIPALLSTVDENLLDWTNVFDTVDKINVRGYPGEEYYYKGGINFWED